GNAPGPAAQYRRRPGRGGGASDAGQPGRGCDRRRQRQADAPAWPLRGARRALLPGHRARPRACRPARAGRAIPDLVRATIKVTMDMPLPALRLAGLRKDFGRPAVDGLDLVVRRGEFYALLGPNGA